MASFGEGLQKVLSLLPGTYGTSLIRNHAMHGAFAEMEKLDMPSEAVQAIRDGVDCNLYFFGDKVGLGSMYAIMIISVLALIGIYIAINILAGRKNK